MRRKAVYVVLVNPGPCLVLLLSLLVFVRSSPKVLPAVHFHGNKELGSAVGYKTFSAKKRRSSPRSPPLAVRFCQC